MGISYRFFVTLLVGMTPLICPGSTDEATMMLDRGGVLAREGKFAEALLETRAACDKRQRDLGDEHELVLRCRVDLARRLTQVGQHREAESMARTAARRLAEIAGPSDPATLEAGQVVAVALFQLGRHAEAEQQASGVYEQRRNALGPDHADTLASLNTLALAMLERGDYRRAREMFSRALASNVTSRGPDDRATLVVKNNLALSHFYLAEYERAEVLYAEVHESRTRSLGPRHASTLPVMTSLADAKLGRGRTADALDHALPALADFQQVLGERHPATLRHRDLLGRIYVDLGRYDQAAAIGEQAVAMANSALGPKHPNTIRYSLNLGRSRFYLRDYAGALEAYEAAAAAADGVLGAKHPETIRAYQGIGYCRLRMNQPREARVAFRRALDASEGVLAESHPYRWALDRGYYAAQFELGERASALRGMEANLAVVARTSGEASEALLSYNAVFANYLIRDGQGARAESLLEHSLKIAESARANDLLGVEFDQRRLAALSDDYSGGVGLKALVELRIARRDFEGALRLSELLKARTLSESMDLRTLANARGVSGRELDDLREALRQLDELARSEPTDPIEQAARRQKLERIVQIKSASLKAPAASEGSRKDIAPEGVFVTFVVNRERVAALVARREGAVQGYFLGELPGLSDSVDALRRWIASPVPAQERVWRMPNGGFRWSLTRPEGGERAHRIDEIVTALSASLLAPMARDLRSVRHWQVSPDGPLALIPFEALTLDGKQVLERHDVSYTQSLQVLARLRARDAHREQRPDGLLAVAATHGPASPPPGSNAPAANWQPLPAAEAEVDAVARAQRGVRTVVLKGEHASEAAIRALARRGELARFRYLHFAAHGYLSATHPQLSSIVLAGDGRSADSDGYLSAAELPALELRSELAIISSCDSGVGRIVSGEGVLGLPYALTLAGNRRTVLALWEVDDRASAQFMPSFHRRLRSGMSVVRALAETKRELARAGSPWRDPRHWAPYVLYGG